MQGRFIAYIPPTAFVKGHGHRVSLVVENEHGHSPTGDTPEGGQVEPWYWGHETDAKKSLEVAEKIADDYNRKNGIEPKEALEILASSMRR